MRSSISSGSFSPSPPNILMPLNSAGLCEAEIMMPASALYFPTRYATAGVGTTPSMMTSAPTEHSPAAQAIASMSDEMRLSMPTTNTGRLRLFPESTAAAAQPRRIASSALSFSLAMPRTPSVPNSLPNQTPPAISGRLCPRPTWGRRCRSPCRRCAPARSRARSKSGRSSSSARRSRRGRARCCSRPRRNRRA